MLKKPSQFIDGHMQAAVCIFFKSHTKTAGMTTKNGSKHRSVCLQRTNMFRNVVHSKSSDWTRPQFF